MALSLNSNFVVWLRTVHTDVQESPGVDRDVAADAAIELLVSNGISIDEPYGEDVTEILQTVLEIGYMRRMRDEYENLV